MGLSCYLFLFIYTIWLESCLVATQLSGEHPWKSAPEQFSRTSLVKMVDGKGQMGQLDNDMSDVKSVEEMRCFLLKQ